MFDARTESERRIADWVPVAAALLAGFAAAWLASPLLPSERVNLGTALARAAGLAGSGFLASFLATVLAFRVFRPSTTWRSVDTAIGFASISAWFAPFLVTAWDGALWLLPVAVVAGALLARLLGLYRRSLADAQDAVEDRDAWMEEFADELFQGLAKARRSQWKREALAVAILLEAGLAATAFGWVAAGSISMALGGLLAGWATRHSIQPQSHVHFGRGVSALSVSGAVAALLLIAAFGEPPLYPGAPFRNGNSGRQGRSLAGKDLVGGVVLRSEDLKKAMVLANVPLPHEPMHGRGRRQLHIPFTGEYWFFPSPGFSPGEDAMVQRGSPLGWVFTNVDKSLMNMRARQSFAIPVPLECCREIHVTVNARPAETGTVSVETILLRYSGKRRATRLSLGKRHLTPVALRGDGSHELATETLAFRVPKSPALDEFDTIEVRFDLHVPRIYRSAKAEVQGFTFVR